MHIPSNLPFRRLNDWNENSSLYKINWKLKTTEMKIQAFTKSTSLDGRGSLSIFPTESASLTLYMRCNSFDWIWIELFKLFVIWVDYVLFATHDSSCQMLQTRHWSVVAHQERGDLGRRHVLTFIKLDIFPLTSDAVFDVTLLSPSKEGRRSKMASTISRSALRTAQQSAVRP